MTRAIVAGPMLLLIVGCGAPAVEPPNPDLAGMEARVAQLETVFAEAVAALAAERAKN